jgi:hypothetical protein
MVTVVRIALILESNFAQSFINFDVLANTHSQTRQSRGCILVKRKEGMVPVRVRRGWRSLISSSSLKNEGAQTWGNIPAVWLQSCGFLRFFVESGWALLPNLLFNV